MTNCLTIGPCARALAERCAARLESLETPCPAALSLSECNATGSLWQVDAYYPTAEESGVAATIAASLGVAPSEIKFSALNGIDWVQRSLAGLSPVRAGPFLVYGSHDRQHRPLNGIAVEINAGTAFGTGHHATTLGCLLALDHLLKGKALRRIIDVGCGSGILAIAAAKAVRRLVIASDIDPEAVRLTAVNARLNATTVLALDAAGTDHARIRAGAPYDLIMANILARPLADLARPFADLSADASRLILSGLLCEQRQMIENIYRASGFFPLRRWHMEGWCTLLLGRKKDHRAKPGDHVSR